MTLASNRAAFSPRNTPAFAVINRPRRIAWRPDLTSRQGPDLSQIGGRVNAGWIERWLASPHTLRPGAIMPTLFAEDDAGQTERYAVAHYLASLGGRARNRVRRENDNGRTASVRRGRALQQSRLHGLPLRRR